MAQRKRMLPIASAGGPLPKVVVDNAKWQTFEKILDKTISPALRRELVDVTNHFLSWAIFEHSAEPLDGAIERITTLSGAANRFRRALTEGGNSDARFYGNYLIERYFNDARMPGRGNKINSLTCIMTSFVVACNRADKEIASRTNAEHRIGDCWGGWIRRLTEILERNEMPTAARKDAADSKSGKASKFVRFVDEFQKSFESKFRRATFSTPALAEAISRARVTKLRKKRTIKTRNAEP
jgi:hypothetical protein